MAGRLLAVSDLHIGYPENRAYADALSPGDPGDWLVVAGDVGEVFADVGFVLASLASRFAKVIWAPGNHELWTLVSHWPLLRGPVGALRHPEFAPWCGTTLTAQWHTRYRVLAAVYGHLHIPRTTHHDGVRFEEVSVGYPASGGAGAPFPRPRGLSSEASRVGARSGP